MKKYMPLEGLRWSRDSGSALCDTSQNSRSRTGWGGVKTGIIPKNHLIHQKSVIAKQGNHALSLLTL